VFEFHKDKQYQHNQEEVNFFLPFTDAYDTNTIWVESEEDKGDYSPINANYGQVVMWNGCHLSHGNKLNTTSNTRVSCDFRVIPLSKYDEDPNASAIYSKMKFIIGDYYKATV
jgi:ectoine hydroxylase-related dioxygenase (phytanoyl-CoA dioxygenase family)